jgi:hypothetical protein
LPLEPIDADRRARAVALFVGVMRVEPMVVGGPPKRSAAAPVDAGASPRPTFAFLRSTTPDTHIEHQGNASCRSLSARHRTTPSVSRRRSADRAGDCTGR